MAKTSQRTPRAQMNLGLGHNLRADVPGEGEAQEMCFLNGNRDRSTTIDHEPCTEDVVIKVPAAVPERAGWDNKLQFMFSAISLSVGLGNVWRFPYLCQQNGGGAFLIPFFVMLFLEGIPVFMLELAVGQKFRQGSLGTWNLIHPWLGGLGIASTLVSFLIGLYYNVIITWCFYYLFNSFQSPLPWSTCPIENGTVIRECAQSSETAYFWYRTTLDVAPTVNETGGIKWWMALCLLLSWTVVYFITMRGIRSSGKVVYVTALFPYAVLIIFFIRAVTLKGAGAGLLHMYTPKMHKLLDPTVWLDAATQVFYSFSIGFGSLISFGSYNPVRNNCVKDALILSLCNVFTALFASAVIFAILGFKGVRSYDKCLDYNKDILLAKFPQYLSNLTFTDDEYLRFMDQHVNNATAVNLQLKHCNLEEIMGESAEGTGLAFIVFTQAIVALPFDFFWAVIFFLMLLALGIGSQIGTLEGVIGTLFDIPFFHSFRKEILSGAVCAVCYLIGLIFVTGAGEYWLKLFDSFAGTTGLILIGFLETVAVMYIYGHQRFSEDIRQMTGYYPGLYWQLTWRFIGPVLIAVLLVTSIIYSCYNKPTYYAWNKEEGRGTMTDYPDWVLGIGAALAIFSIIPIPVVCLLRRFQCLRLDANIHQGAIRRNETTISTKQMITDVDLDDYQDIPIEEANEDAESDDGPLQMATSKFRLQVSDRKE